jgi:TPP-dependent pyruvate/acetoin dehydrogenase alpha subunit
MSSRTVPAAEPAAGPAIPGALTRAQLLEIYYYLRLTRTLEERLSALYRQARVIGGLFRSPSDVEECLAAHADDGCRGLGRAVLFQ